MIAFSIWPINVYWYGIIFLINFALGYAFLSFVAKQWWLRHVPKIEKLFMTKLDDVVFAAALGIIVGGRVGEILFYEPAYYLANPLKVFYVREGWMSFFGGVLWVVIAMLIFARKNNLTWSDLLSVFDSTLTYAPFGIILGRFANFLNQELYGLPVPADAWWLSDWTVAFLTKTHFFYVYSHVDNLLRVNTNFLSMLTEGLLVFVIMISAYLLYYRKGKLKSGFMIWLFFIFYGLARFFLDYLRIDAQTQLHLGISVTQWFSVLFGIVGIWFVISRVTKK